MGKFWGLCEAPGTWASSSPTLPRSGPPWTRKEEHSQPPDTSWPRGPSFGPLITLPGPGWLGLTTMGGPRLRIGRQSPLSAPLLRPPSRVPSECRGIRTPARPGRGRAQRLSSPDLRRELGPAGAGRPGHSGLAWPGAFSRRAPGPRPLTRKEKPRLWLYGAAQAVSLWGVWAALR